MATVGGIQSYMWRLWEMLDVISQTNGSRVNGLSLMDKPELLAACSNHVQLRPGGASGRRVRFLQLAMSRSYNADCIVVGHIHLASVALLARCLGRTKRYVVVMHGIEAWQRATLLQRIGLRHADVVVVTTRFTAETCAKINGLPSQNFKVIPLCAEPKPAMPDPNFVLDGAFPILFVGRLAKTEKYKGLETLMQSVARLFKAQVPCKIHVIGDGDDRPRLQALALSFGLTGNTIRFHGQVSDAVLQAAYASAKVFAMPSSKEGFGIVFLEAMRHGVPCIGGAHGGTPEVFSSGSEGFLVNYDDVVTLAQHLQTLITDEKLRQRFAIAGRQRFVSQYTFTPFFQRWLALLHEHQ